MQEPRFGPPPDEPRTRPPLPFWDRIKFILLFVGVWGILVWNSYIEIEIVGGTVVDAVEEQLRDGAVWLALAWLEVIRQLHYLVSEQWAGWHQFWSRRVFGGVNRRLARLNDWNRYRLGRALKWIAALAILAFILGQVYDVPASQALFELPATAYAALPMVLQVVFLMFAVVMQFVAIFWFMSKGGVEVLMPNDVRTRFSDVWGQDQVVDRVRENLLFLEAPEKIEEKGGYVPSGLLLWGPPGTGKTLVAEAAAGETGKPFVFVEPGAFTNMFFGVGVLKVKSLFRRIRKLAVRYGGVVVFFDEADSLGNRGRLTQTGGLPGAGASAVQDTPWSRATSCNGLSYLSPTSATLTLQSHMDAHTHVEQPRRWRDGIIMPGMGGGDVMALQALLAEMQGLKKPRGFINRFVRRVLGMRPKPPPKYRMLLMMATNLPEALDEALLRPGRIDRIYKVGYPSKAGRIRTYEGYLDKVSHELSEEEIDKLATITPYATGATIKDLVNEALINAIRDGRDTILWPDVIRAKQLRELGLPEDVEYIDRERHAIAVHEACHAVSAYRERHHLTIDLATLEKGGNYLGMVASIPPEDQFTRWRSEYEADIVVALASLAGERMFFEGDNSSGVSGDLDTATLIATYMEGYWGMGNTIASHGVTHRVGIGGGGGGGPTPRETEKGRKQRELLEGHLGERIERKLTDIYARTEQLLHENRREILSVAHALETHKTLTGDDVKAIIDGTQGPLIDGRVYHAPGSAAVLEEYHREAVSAHTAHGRLRTELPALAEIVLDSSAVAVTNGHANGENAAPTRRRRRSADPDDEPTA